MTPDVKIQGPLTTDRVVDAALRIADTNGIDGVTLRRIASILGVTPMAIYRHVRDKGHLLDLMAERILMELDPASTESPSWQEALRRVAASILAVVQRHPAAPFLLSRPFVSPSALRVTETMLAILDRAGFDPSESVRLVQVLTGMILGPAIHRATYAAAWRESATDAEPQDAPWTALTAEDLPNLARVVDQLMDWRPGPEADELTIEMWVAGVEQLANRRLSQGG
jgi:TetR/AcrR family tetracycline transcriptional repressor